MLIFMVRHGIAEDTHRGGRDEDRELTEEGRLRLADVFRRMGKANIRPAVILTSPLVRARQTAEIAVQALKCGVAPETTPRLTPEATPEDVWDEIRDHREVQSLMLVGHEPLFSRTVAYLLNSPTLQVDVKKGSVTAIEVQSFRGGLPQGVLKWMLTPKLCG